MLVSINKRKEDVVKEETKKMREFENIYGTTHERTRARRPAAAHPHLLVHNHSTEKRGFYDRSLFYICKTCRKSTLYRLPTYVSRSYVNIKRKIYIRIHIIYIHAFIHICILYNV